MHLLTNSFTRITFALFAFALIVIAQNESDKMCDDILGCFPARDFFEGNVIGATKVRPETSDHLDMKFYYFHTAGRKGKLLRFNSSVDQLDDFDTSSPVYFTVHGWREKYENLGWMESLKDLILDKLQGRANVFLLDWGSKSTNMIYPVSAANTRVVGEALAYFIHALQTHFHITCDNVHVIGFSLGAQVAGFGGHILQKKHNCQLATITGLDPAGPFFRDHKPDERLDPTDAKHVSVLHSNMASTVLHGFGNPSKLGHVDVFVNGGSLQPGCNSLDLAGEVVASGLNPASLNAIGCSHSRAEELFKLNYFRHTKCQPVAYQCENYEEFQKGRCADCGEDGSKCHLVGFNPSFVPKKPENSEWGYYLDTGKEVPFCQFHYQIKVYLNPKSAAMSGTLFMDLLGQTRDVEDVKLERIFTTFSPGAPNIILFKYPEPLGRVDQARIYIQPSVRGRVTGLFNKKPLKVDMIEINYMSHIDADIRKHQSSRLCPENQDNSVPESKSKQMVYRICKQGETSEWDRTV